MDQLLHRLSPLALCTACRTTLLRISRSPRYDLQNSPRTPRRRYSSAEPTTPSPNQYQASPIEGYYKLLLDSPSTTSPNPIPTAPPDALQETPKASQARVIFGSRLAGPSTKPAQPHQLIAGVRVPPRPAEPDNCCMSGCVNCVWDVYRDDMEEWAAASREAGRRLREQDRGLMDRGTTMDDDGGGSEANWDLVAGANEEELFGNIPVGIREFMRTEKRLKENRLQNAGG
ncbi:MAG: hypothetical protein M1840_001781 [Geoglossum simile]|nr:MAG: hypothetical protein M1840_001781 [Geoglossum simile]